MGKRSRTWTNVRGAGETAKWLCDRVDYDGEECLIWPFSLTRDGYGNLGYEGKLHYAHRFMCELVNGPPPTPDHETAHSCGRGHDACVHPKHVSWKTRTENERDKVAHGTTWGNRTERYKLTEPQVIEIRTLYPGKTVTELAAMFDVTRSNIRKILKRETWPHVISAG
jgi:hypothetical protein